jgi:adenosine kinase
MVEKISQLLILGVENPLLDISTIGTEDMYKNYNLPLEGTVLAEKKHLALFKEIKEHHNPNYVPGGSTQNTIRAVQVPLRITLVVAQPEVSLCLCFYGKHW